MEGINKKFEQTGLFDKDSRNEEVEGLKKTKTFAEYTTQQKLGFEQRLKRKKENPRERLDQDELDYLEAKGKAFSGQ